MRLLIVRNVERRLGGLFDQDSEGTCRMYIKVNIWTTKRGLTLNFEARIRLNESTINRKLYHHLFASNSIFPFPSENKSSISIVSDAIPLFQPIKSIMDTATAKRIPFHDVGLSATDEQQSRQTTKAEEILDQIAEPNQEKKEPMIQIR